MERWLKSLIEDAVKRALEEDGGALRDAVIEEMREQLDDVIQEIVTEELS